MSLASFLPFGTSTSIDPLGLSSTMIARVIVPGTLARPSWMGSFSRRSIFSGVMAPAGNTTSTPPRVSATGGTRVPENQGDLPGWMTTGELGMSSFRTEMRLLTLCPTGAFASTSGYTQISSSTLRFPRVSSGPGRTGSSEMSAVLVHGLDLLPSAPSDSPTPCRDPLPAGIRG